MSITQGGVGTSGAASGGISEDTRTATGAGSSSGLVSMSNDNMSGDASGVPLFSPNSEFFKSGRGCGGDASRGGVGRGGRGASAVERTVASATSTTESAMAARIEQWEQSLASMAGHGASTSTPYEGEFFSYLASATQVKASVAVTRDGALASEPHAATLELEPQRAPTLCELGSITAMSVEICESSREEQSSTSISGYGPMSELFERFISGARPLGSSPVVLASVPGFSGVLTWPNELLEGNMSADNTPVYEYLEEVMSFAAAVSSSLDVPLWSSYHALQQEANRLMKKCCSETSLPTQVVKVVDWSPMALVNRVVYQLMEPNTDERESAMGFMTGVTATSFVSKASRRQIELASDTPIFHHPYRYSDVESYLIRSRTLELLEVVWEYVNKVCAFMGLANYYRRYMKGFSAIPKPLNQLLKSDKERQWFKAKLVAAPILKRPIRGRPYQLHIDEYVGHWSGVDVV
ncbi:hypothetical protein AXG93_1988s1200 [Marchantia polymorpha subsp. ruderalis]|uniref:Reverse transcriptase/retrotransposon-derived protein RNase H-like domain-containing protein n=1 Tax=Marchantia polymorpha subsp. ruderalis TaxID=1480154 RepID=A0A176VXD2_MARPO|nr:hypothetical protein AXG93_1988s1200 [Marchantia polymorpha subsp. ruderalis]